MGERDNGCNHYFIRPEQKWNGRGWQWDFSSREPIPLPHEEEDEVLLYEAEDEGLLSRLSNKVIEMVGDGRLRNVSRILRELTHLG
jgi:hypothetical protein